MLYVYLFFQYSTNQTCFMKRCILMALMVVSFAIQTQAQQLPKSLREEKWVQIMANDSAMNFFEAEAAFKKFHTGWLAKEKAERAEEASNPAGEEQRRGPEEYLIAAYLKWSLAMKPFVLSDGKLMPLTQRLAIIQQARKKQQQ
jgi:hypothetical protein